MSTGLKKYHLDISEDGLPISRKSARLFFGVHSFFFIRLNQMIHVENLSVACFRVFFKFFFPPLMVSIKLNVILNRESIKYSVKKKKFFLSPSLSVCSFQTFHQFKMKTANNNNMKKKRRMLQ